ncbi:MAG: cyclic nucleotide-binding domain-containing protein [Campylobacterales bacterium]
MFTKYTPEEVRLLKEVATKKSKPIREPDSHLEVDKINVKNLAKWGFVRRYNVNEILFRENDPGEEMFLILQGQCSVSIQGNEIATLGVGDFFGEMALLDGLPRSATVQAIENMAVLVIDAKNFEQVIRLEPLIAIRIMQTLSKRIRTLNQSLITERMCHNTVETDLNKL